MYPLKKCRVVITMSVVAAPTPEIMVAIAVAAEMADESDQEKDIKLLSFPSTCSTNN